MVKRHKIYWMMFGLVSFVAASNIGNPHDRNVSPAGAAAPTVKKSAEVAPSNPKLDMTKIANAYKLYVGEKGEISLPQNYRTKWIHLGSFAVAKKKGQSVSSMHGVYTQPEVAAIFNRTGKFPDGAVLVKEVRHAKNGKMTTGQVGWATKMNVWFVMIKDAKGRFKKSDHWGDGWGWALFEAKRKAPRKNVSAGYQTSCIGCHYPAEKTDWIYMRGYPTLKPPESK